MLYISFFLFCQQFKGQAASIIGSVDFLGNPFGLLNDVTSGVSGVMTSGDLPGLVARVAHGVTDSASKVYKALIPLSFTIVII